MRILWVATKPPWPPVDGGRLLTHLTLAALTAAGHEVVLAAPAGEGADVPGSLPYRVETVAGRRGSWAGALPRAAAGLPLTAARHRLPALSAAVGRLVAAEPFDLVQAEQVQALHACLPARRRGLPLAVRCQNVESDLWDAAGSARGGPAGALLRLESRRVARWEGRQVAGADLAFALTARDASRLADLAGLPRPLPVVPPPFPARLPAGAARLAGDPALVILGPGSWLPNAAGASWFVRACWPALRARFPGAALHVFGTLAGRGGAPGVHRHPPPPESAAAFGPASVLVVPLRIASGVRMKILEAWARGCPVIATPEAAAGLGAAPGREYLEAADAGGFAAALDALRADPALGGRLAAAGRARLAREFDPARVAGRLLELYRRLAAV